MGIQYQNTCMAELHPICACDQCVWSSSTIYGINVIVLLPRLLNLLLK